MTVRAGYIAVITAVASVATMALVPSFVAAQTPTPRKMGMEKHPMLTRAQRQIEMAKSSLQHADRDFGGHRTKAVELLNQALAEIKAAKEFDRH